MDKTLRSVVILVLSFFLVSRAVWAEGISNESQTTTGEIPADNSTGGTAAFSMNYFSIFYGPGIKDASAYQPGPTGSPDYDRPLFLKNYLGASYNLNDAIAITPTAYWTWQAGDSRPFQMRDPFLRISHNSIVHTDRLNLYSDLRIHFPISTISRDNDLLAGFQTFQILTYEVGDSRRLTLGLYGSARTNVYGSQGFGDDLELYAGPNLSYQIAPTLALTVLYEMGCSHAFGQEPFHFNNDGTDLEPGVSWDVTPNLMLNPYVNLYTGDRINWRSTAFGMMMSWRMI